MPFSKEEKARRRALVALELGKRLIPRGDANKAILEQIRKSGDTVPVEKKRSRPKKVEEPPVPTLTAMTIMKGTSAAPTRRNGNAHHRLRANLTHFLQIRTKTTRKRRLTSLHRLMVKTTR